MKLYIALFVCLFPFVTVGAELAIEIPPGGSSSELILESSADTVYSLERSENAASGPWTGTDILIGDGTVQVIPISLPTDKTFYRVERVLDPATFTLPPSDPNPSPDNDFSEELQLAFTGIGSGQIITTGWVLPDEKSSSTVDIDKEVTFTDLAGVEVITPPFVVLGEGNDKVGDDPESFASESPAPANRPASTRPIRAPGVEIYQNGAPSGNTGSIIIDGNQVSIDGVGPFDFGRDFGRNPTLEERVREAVQNAPEPPSELQRQIACGEGALSVANARIVSSTYSITTRLPDGTSIVETHSFHFQYALVYNCETETLERVVYLRYSSRSQFFSQTGEPVGSPASESASYIDIDAR